MVFASKKVVNKMEMWTNHKPLLEIVPPVKASRMIPEWFEKLHSDLDVLDPEFPKTAPIVREYMSHTIKKCPAIVDYLAEGFIIPYWTDTIIQRIDNKFLFEHNQTALNDGFGQIEFHSFDQLSTFPFKEGDFNEGVKFISPWFFRTPPGWSTLFLPPLLHNEDRFTILPGIVETDVFHQVNFPSIFHLEGQTIIKRGEPFLQAIPFKRESIDLEIRLSTDEDRQLIEDQGMELRSKFTNGYRDITRRNRKKNGK